MRRRSAVFICCMDQVQDTFHWPDKASSCFDARAPTTEGLNCETVWRFYLLWLMAIRLSCLHILLPHIWTFGEPTEDFELSTIIEIWFVKLIIDRQKKSYINFVRLWNLNLHLKGMMFIEGMTFFVPRNIDTCPTKVRTIAFQKFVKGLLWLLEDKMLRRMFEPKRHEVIGDWRKFCEATPPPLVFLSNICHLWLLAMSWKVYSCATVGNLSVPLEQS
jgi:hypothetical protein